MMDWRDTSLASPLLLVDWSLRWAAVIAVLAAVLKVHPPRRPAARLLLCRLVLVGGLLLPLLPHCWGPALPRPQSRETMANLGQVKDMPQRSASVPAPGPRPQARPTEAPPSSPARAEAPADPDSEMAVAEQPVLPAWPRWIIPALAVVWAGGAALMLGRLLAGWFCLMRFRREAEPADEAAQEFYRHCRSELCVRRSARLMSHPAIASPILIGGWRPCILVPPDWHHLPEAARRSSLLHDLAHLARCDDWLKLGEEMVRCLFFFHPLVHWLLDRLEGEREVLCDAVVVRQGVAPRQLAHVLLDFTRRLGPGRSAVPDSLATSFFHRMTVKDRIHRLLEDDMTVWTAPLSRSRMLALAAGVLAAMAGLGSLGVRSARSVEPPETPKAPLAAPAAPKTVGAPAPQKGIPLEGRLVDAQRKPVANATIIGMCRTMMCAPLRGPAIVTDKNGRFRVDNAPDGPLNPKSVVSLRVKTADGQSYEVNVVGILAGEMQVKLPRATASGLKVPKDVKSGELAGVVVDEAGKPLPGVEVDVWDWYPGNETRTDKDGVFRLKDLGRDRKVQVRFRKAGYSPWMFMQQPTGVAGWVVAMDRKTYFEGVVRGPDGKPAAGALLRADQGPKQMDGGIATHIWTETRADASGRYRLYVQPDEYEFVVKAPGIGVARLPRRGIVHGTAESLDIQLQKGFTFRAVTVDAETGKPVAGVRLWSWQHRDVEGRSDARGEAAISEMLPGKFDFQIEKDGYARWWSEQTVSVWNRRTIVEPALKWQRNFDNLDFDLRPDMPKVKIVLEKGVRIRGRVLDPDGKPVAGATVAPALTGTGNSLTGDSRFSVPTRADGTFEVLMPASNEAQYNLVVHDGAIFKWRKWANGVLPPIRTKPGEEIKDVTLRLTRPATVRGKVVDDKGNPVAYREVRASAVDKRENRYYDPTTTTREDGTFELRFIRPGEQYIQVAPFWLLAAQAPGKTTQKMRLKAGETVEDVQLVAVEQPR